MSTIVVPALRRELIELLWKRAPNLQIAVVAFSVPTMSLAGTTKKWAKVLH